MDEGAAVSVIFGQAEVILLDIPMLVVWLRGHCQGPLPWCLSSVKDEVIVLFAVLRVERLVLSASL